MTKRIIVFAVMALASFAVRAQHFEWAKGYGSAQEGCLIKGSVTDAEGNLYILGQFRNDATWDGQRLLPIAPYGPGFNTTNVLIAKISPSGEMLWKKVIHSNNGNSSIPWDIKALSDTGFAVMLTAHMCFPQINYLYWLDTLYVADYQPISPYQYEDRRFAESLFNAYLTFDFEGNVQEQHFIQLSGVDTNGNDIMDNPYQNPDSLLWLNMQVMHNLTFDLDSEGNIYICRDAVDQYGVDYQSWDGTVGAVKVWVDHQYIGMVPIEKKPRWVPQLMKFSPHFDRILANRYVIQQSENMDCYSLCYLKNDNTHVFLIQTLGITYPNNNTLVIDSVGNLELPIVAQSAFKGFVTLFDWDLHPNYCIHIKDSIIEAVNSYSMSWL